jgi:tRNA(Arg) A34 adenosine deaminase TadA
MERSDPMETLAPSDEEHLRRAIVLGEAAAVHGNRPFGAVLVGADGAVLAEAENSTVTDDDIASHAEINAIRSVCRGGRQDALIGATSFTNFPPCPMCAGAMMRFGFARIVYAADWDAMKGVVPTQSAAFGADLEQMTRHAERPLRVIGPCLGEVAPAKSRA